MYSSRSRVENFTGKNYAAQPRKAGAKRAFGKNLSNNAAAHADKKNKTSLMSKTTRNAKALRTGAQRGLTRYSKQQFFGNKTAAAAGDSMAIDTQSNRSTHKNAKKQRIMRATLSNNTAGGSSSMATDRRQRAVVAPAVPTLDYEDIDVYDEDDAQSCTEYVNEIFAYLRQKEVAERVDDDYMSHQSDLTPKMRSILVDWMVDVHLKFKLLSETMFLSVNIIDRFLSAKEVSRETLQLVGITAMLIASKYEEIYSPEVRDFVYICDQAFQQEQILALEIRILNKLNFSLTPATPLHFLRRFSKAARSDSHTHTLSKYLIELSLPEYGMLAYKPSTIAAAAVYIARAMHNLTPYWNDTLHHYTQHSVEQLRPCAETLNAALLRTKTSNLKATRRKYSSGKLLSVARISPLQELPF